MTSVFCCLLLLFSKRKKDVQDRCEDAYYTKKEKRREKAYFCSIELFLA